MAVVRWLVASLPASGSLLRQKAPIYLALRQGLQVLLLCSSVPKVSRPQHTRLLFTLMTTLVLASILGSPPWPARS